MHTPRWLIFLYSLILIVGIIFALPNLFSDEHLKSPYLSWLPDTRVTLGLDLQGGSSLTLQVNKDDLKKEQLKIALNTVRKALRDAQIQPASNRVLGDAVVITLKNDTDKATAMEAIKKVTTPVAVGTMGGSTPDLAIEEQPNGIRVSLTNAAIENRLAGAVEQSLEIVRNRVDEVGVAEPSIQKVQDDRIEVQLPGYDNPEELKQLLGETAKLTFHLMPENVDLNNLPFGVEALDLATPQERSQYPGGKVPVYSQVSLDGGMLTDAKVRYDENGKPVISFSLNSTGATIFRDITRQNIGKPFAIVLDNKVLMAPTINGVIPNGQGQITGSWDYKYASTLAAQLRAGALPVPLTVIEQRVVGPDLGADAIRMGVFTGIIGFILVAVFIFLLYGLWGIIADVALALHTILTFSALSFLGATLTLPGIAGIILGIGIAVDANILINERIREETRNGFGAKAALDRGFKHAFATIVDANVTAVIAMLLLYWQGTGPVRGFAVTMLLGIIISMFTDITIVRIMMAWVVKKWKITTLHIQPFLNFIPQHTNFHFMNARYLGIGTSIVLSIASIILFIKPGLNYGIDFLGGSTVTISTQQPAEISKLRSEVSNLNLGETTIQSISNDGRGYAIRIQRQPGGEEDQTHARLAVINKVKQLYSDVKIESESTVGPKVSGELAHKGAVAVICAALAMAAYIWWRFEWFFAVGALVTLILDTTKMVGVFVLFQFDFNLTAIAALLTIVGYSINDKVVVYDRMRENLRLYKKMSLREVIDLSINQVLVRCIFTSATTVLSMLPMAIWGGSAVHNFALPIVIGIVIATSSSIFIAAPVLLFLGDWWHKHHKGRDKDIVSKKPAVEKS